jgi:hypothetical protein
MQTESAACIKLRRANHYRLAVGCEVLSRISMATLAGNARMEKAAACSD